MLLTTLTLDELRLLVAPGEAGVLDAKVESELIDLPPEEARELLESTPATVEQHLCRPG